MTVLLAALLLGAAPDAWALPAARPCTAVELIALTAEAATPYRLTCRAVLMPGQSILRPC